MGLRECSRSRTKAIGDLLDPIASRLTAKAAQATAHAERAPPTGKPDARPQPSRGYLPRTFLQTTLPHSQLPADQTQFSRWTGNYTIWISKATDYGLPYGGLARLILAWLCTEAVRTSSPTIYVGSSRSDFVRALRLQVTGRNMNSVRDQMLRLLNCTIALRVHPRASESGEMQDNTNFNHIATHIHNFWVPTPGCGAGAWRSTIVLSDEFYTNLRDHAVPLDLTIYRDLLRSPMAMDIYAWLIYRLFTLAVSHKQEVHIPWTLLRDQLGVGYPNTPQGYADFRNNFRRQLWKVAEVYRPAAVQVTPTKEHLTLRSKRAGLIHRPSPSRPVIHSNAMYDHSEKHVPSLRNP